MTSDWLRALSTDASISTRAGIICYSASHAQLRGEVLGAHKLGLPLNLHGMV